MTVRPYWSPRQPLTQRSSPGQRIGRELALEVRRRAAGAEVGPGHAVDRLTVGRQAGDLGVGAVVLDHLVGRPGHQHPGDAVDGGHAALLHTVHGGERPARDHPAARRVRRHRHHVPVCCGRPVQQSSGRCADGGEAGPTLTTDVGEAATEVELVAVHRECGDPAVRRGVEVRDDRTGLSVERDEPPARLASDRGEVTADEDARAVTRGGDRHALRVERGSPGRDQRTGGEVVGEDVRPGRLVLARGGTGWARLGERPGDVDPVADDDLVPHHAVDLNGGQPVRGDSLRFTRHRR